MKLLDCARCLTALNQRRSSRRRDDCETTDPLVMTKRPPTRHHHHHHHHRRSESAPRIASSSRFSNGRFLSAMRNFGASWKRRRINAGARSKLETRSKKSLVGSDEGGLKRVGIRGTLNGVHLRKRKIPARIEEVGIAGRRAPGELEREYYEHLEALKFLIDPPPCFRNTETRQNFENKLNSLDFRRMNTVAIPAGPENGPDDDYYSADWCAIRENGGSRRYAQATLDRIVAEHLRIERTMIDLFARAPILKGRHGEQVPAPSRENKTVRFKDEVERTGTSVGQREDSWRGGEGCEGVRSDNRAAREIAKAGSDARRAGGNSTVSDVETTNGR